MDCEKIKATLSSSKAVWQVCNEKKEEQMAGGCEKKKQGCMGLI